MAERGTAEDRSGDDAPAARGLSTVDRIYGAIGIAAVLLAVFFLLRGGGADTGRQASASPPPAITVLEPRPGAEVRQPLTVMFDARTDLGGDGSDRAAGRHLHARIGATELMAGPADVQRLSGTRYEWTLPRVAPGPQQLTLYWSDARHRPIPNAAAAPVPVTLR